MSLLTDSDWRKVRLFLARIPNVELAGARLQLGLELKTREAVDTNAARLLFSSLEPADLERAKNLIAEEIKARQADLEWLESQGVEVGHAE